MKITLDELEKQFPTVFEWIDPYIMDGEIQWQVMKTEGYDFWETVLNSDNIGVYDKWLSNLIQIIKERQGASIRKEIERDAKDKMKEELVNIGNIYNKQIDELNQDCDKLTNTISVKDREIQKLKKDINVLNKEILKLNKENDSLIKKNEHESIFSNLKFSIGDVIYLVTGHNTPYIITSLKICNNGVFYFIKTETSDEFLVSEIEIKKKK